MTAGTGGAAAPPLDGVRVLDFSRVLAGPHCGRMLADLGADVIKVEPPEGDLTRFASPRVASLSLYFTQQNCGKRNISLDLSRPEAADLLLRMAPHVDVVLENFRPGVMARMGLGPDEWEARNGRIVYAAITGYGQDGPWRDRRAYARVIHAEAGTMLLDAAAKARGPEHDSFSHADVYAALECVGAVLAALLVRERTGHGQRVDVAMAETMLCVNEHTAVDVSGLTDATDTLGRAPGAVFRVGDGGWVTTASDPAARIDFPLFLQAMGRPELADDARFATVEHRKANRDALVAEIQAWVDGLGTAEAVEAALAGVRIPVGRLRTVAEVAATDWADHRGAVVRVDDRAGGSVPVPNSPWRFSTSPTGVRGVAAYRGEHNGEVLRELLGLDDEEVGRLESGGVLSSRGASPTAG